jgi:3-oxoacyl-[acyl-carrier protein] reductase
MALAAESTSTTRLPKDLLNGRVAIVTGGSRGIGRATALRLAEAGAHVVVNYAHNADAANEVVAGLRDSGVHALSVRADVADAGQSALLAQYAVEQFGKIDVLVANAGIWKGAPVEEMDEDLWDEVLDVNLKGTWTSVRAVVPQMKLQKKGSIVIVSSTAGQRGEAGYSNYAASKGGQISFAKSLSTELAPHIRVNCVAPGWVDTELNDPVFAAADHYKAHVTKAIPLQRLATPDDVALSVAFLASDWSQHITGEVINLNGGSVLCG